MLNITLTGDSGAIVNNVLQWKIMLTLARFFMTLCTADAWSMNGNNHHLLWNSFRCDRMQKKFNFFLFTLIIFGLVCNKNEINRNHSEFHNKKKSKIPLTMANIDLVWKYTCNTIFFLHARLFYAFDLFSLYNYTICGRLPITRGKFYDKKCHFSFLDEAKKWLKKKAPALYLNFNTRIATKVIRTAPSIGSA